MKKWIDLAGLASTLLVSAVLFANQPNVYCPEQNPNQTQARKVYEPVLRYQYQKRNPEVYSFNIKDILNPDKKYNVWVENNLMCKFMGEIEPGDIKIQFIELIEPVKLPMRERIVQEVPNSQPQQYSPKRHYTITPLSEKRLPDGRLEVKIFTSEGEKTIIVDGK